MSNPTLAQSLREVVAGLEACERSFRQRHEYEQNARGLGELRIPAEEALDPNGRLILGDMLAARAQALAALANLDRSTP